MSRNPYPFTANSNTSQGSHQSSYAQQSPIPSPNASSASLPGSQRQYYGNASATPSTANLLPSSPQDGTPGARATFASGPSLRNQASNNSLRDDGPYNLGSSPGKTASIAPSISDKFSLAPDPQVWGANLSLNQTEPDDYLHNPDPRRDRKNDKGGTIFTSRGFANLGFLALLALALVTLFAGYPLITYFTKHSLSLFGGFNIGGTNATGQVPTMPGNWGMIDLETPKDAYTITGYQNQADMQLVFSDEFNTDGRTFYPGDDPYWEAVDLHYWQTNNLEWYDPAAITTQDGALHITLSAQNPIDNHDLNYRGGMMSTWNKFCFTGGVLVASVSLPGTNNIVGLWPAVWAMGNLGRAGYGASLEGMWPYTYDSCDVGTLPNQTQNGLPLAATVNGDQQQNGILSFLPGQRLSRCTCQGESHPGPVHADGTYVGRSAPEIDVFEAQITGTPLSGQVSQSAQWGPFNAAYQWFNTSANLIIPNATGSILNSYMGGAFQQATSVVTDSNQGCYELTQDCFSVYGFEYKPGFDGAYISWIADNKLAWTLNQAGMAADTRVEISARPVPQEPMYIIANLGMSTNFGTVDLEHLTFPTTMKIDYIRVYQFTDSINVGCDPKDFPTAAYIDQYLEAYTNPNLTTWRNDFKQPFPKNKLIDSC